MVSNKQQLNEIFQVLFANHFIISEAANHLAFFRVDIIFHEFTAFKWFLMLNVCIHFILDNS